MLPGSSATGPTQPIVGRDDLLAQARAVFAGGAGVVLRGDPGSGTTRLVRELTADAAPGALLELRATESGATMPLGVLVNPAPA